MQRQTGTAGGADNICAISDAAAGDLPLMVPGSLQSLPLASSREVMPAKTQLSKEAVRTGRAV